MKFLTGFALLWAVVFTVQAQINPWQARHGLTSDQYQSTFDGLVSQGYRLNYVSGYTVNNAARFAAIWEKKQSPDWVARHDMNSSQYQDNFNTFVGQGFRLVLVNGYTVNDVDRYVAIWDKSPSGAWVARHGMTSSDYQTAFDGFAKQGYRLKHVSGYAVGAEARYAAIWEKTNDGPAWVARHGLTSAAYQQQFDTLVSQGYTLALVSGYSVGNVDYYAAIWEQKSGPAWIARHGMTSPQYQGEFNNQYYQGYMLKVVSGYTISNADRYAAIWENNAMSGADLAIIDNDVKAYMDKQKIPGLSIAITKDERLVFAKGYGYADQSANVMVNPNHLFRIMSVSKSITSITIMKLIQDNRFRITDKVFGSGAILGTKYGTKVVNGVKTYNPGVTDITIQNLLEHQAGWGANSDPEGWLKTKSPADAVTAVLDTVPLAYTPGTSNMYSNFGFLILGRVIEEVTSQPYETYVRNNILNQAQINRMQLADDTGPVQDEVKYYPLGVTNSWRIHEFDSFGGWLATPIDLTRLVVRVDNLTAKPDILSQTTEAKMFEPSSTNPGYGKGWILGPGWRGHNGAFGGTGSYLVTKTDGSHFSFAAVGNMNSPTDPYSGALRDVVDGICSKVGSWPAYDLF